MCSLHGGTSTSKASKAPLPVLIESCPSAAAFPTATAPPALRQGPQGVPLPMALHPIVQQAAQRHSAIRKPPPYSKLYRTLVWRERGSALCSPMPSIPRHDMNMQQALLAATCTSLEETAVSCLLSGLSACHFRRCREGTTLQLL